MAIIIITIGLYAYLFYFFRQVFAVEQQPSTQELKENDTYHIMSVMADPHQHAGHAHLPRPTLEESQTTLAEMGPFELPVEASQKSLPALPGDDKAYQANHQALGELTGEFPVFELEGDAPMKEAEEDLPRKSLPTRPTEWRRSDAYIM
jgi:hypothetical protein